MQRKKGKFIKLDAVSFETRGVRRFFPSLPEKKENKTSLTPVSRAKEKKKNEIRNKEEGKSTVV